MRPTLTSLDWFIIGAYVVGALALGAYFTRQASRGVQSFFVGDRNLPWWLAGTSIVATTFAADTPLAVTGLVASGGISHNWIWWSWGVAHVVATFLFAGMWRRSGVITDAEITELRYSGRPAAALRAFKAVYYGGFINCLTMAWVIAAMVKISRAFFDVPPGAVIAGSVAVSVTYTLLGGFRSVVVTDLIQFTLGMLGAVVFAGFVLDHFGGMGGPPEAPKAAGLLEQLDHVTAAAGTALGDLTDMVPRTDHPHLPWIYFVVLLTAGWWRYAEGNGYIVQRFAATRSPRHAEGASLWFAVAHNALRPWPWIIVALGALVVFPQRPSVPSVTDRTGTFTVAPATLDVFDGGSVTLRPGPGVTVPPSPRLRVAGQTVPLRPEGSAWRGTFTGWGDTMLSTQAELLRADGTTHAVFENVSVQLQDREMAYPVLMGLLLPAGFLGWVIASLLAAFMSTIDTHTNWGASYFVRDLYQRFLRPRASEAECVWVSRSAIVLMGLLAGATALVVRSIGEVWVFLVTLGAGLGSVTAARWYWWRVTAHAEFAAMFTTSIVAVALQLFATPTLFGGPNDLFVIAVPRWAQILIVAAASLATWLPVALWGPQEDRTHLARFAQRVRPFGPGWRGVGVSPHGRLRFQLARVGAGLVLVYGILFGIGHLVLGRTVAALGTLVLAAVALLWLLSTAAPRPSPQADVEPEPEGSYQA